MAYNHFDYVPSGISKSRSVFKFEKAIAGGCEIGFLYPMCKPIAMMPGSSLKLNLAMEVRSGALIAPLQDELLLDVFAFNVPNRIVWEHWKQFVGATDDVLFDSLSDYQIPSFKYDPFCAAVENSYGYATSHLLASWYELPMVEYDKQDASYSANYLPRISALPFRGYSFIWNENFRPEQLVTPVLFSKTDNGYTGDNITHSWYDGTISIGGTSNIVPIVPTAGSSDVGCSGGCVLPTFRVHKSLWTSCLPKPSLETLNLLGDLSAPVGLLRSSDYSLSANVNPQIASGTSIVGGKLQQFTMTSGLTGDVVADLSQAILTVNNYRETIMLQNYYDALNRAGSRYDEIIRNIFHTQTSNAVIDIPELIVHKRFTIFRKEVVATAETLKSDNTVANPVGNQSAYIDTVVKDSFFTTSTTEHGYVHPLFTIRPARIRMAQGIEPDWVKLNKFDMYYPQFDGMGDVPRYKNEIYVPDVPSASTNAAIFGYQEYGAEYKYQRNSAVGWADVNLLNHIAGLTLAEKLVAQPSLASATNFGYMGYLSCLVEEQAFASCLAVSSPSVSPQFIVDIRLTGEIVHPMPVYNIPGMGDLL